MKRMLNDGKVYITVENHDETEYLMSSPRNREHLIRAMNKANNNINLIEVPMEEIERQINELDDN